MLLSFPNIYDPLARKDDLLLCFWKPEVLIKLFTIHHIFPS